nr:hypothetical protein BaRGS_031017 [Batillaria attramentaria]
MCVCVKERAQGVPLRRTKLSKDVRGGTWSQELVNKCPSGAGWLTWHSMCYLFVNTTRITWDQARTECRAREGRLLRIETGDEYNFVTQALKQYPSDAYWTALNDLPLNEPSNTPRGTGVFLWGNDEIPSDVVVKNHWDKEPDNTPWEDCVQVSTQGELSVEDCNNRHGYICQIAAASGYFAGGPIRQVFWTGLNDKANENTFVWQGNENTPFDQTIMSGVESTEGSKAGAVFIMHDNGDEDDGGEWSDRNCDDQLNYACRLVPPGDTQEWNMGCGQWTRAGRKCIFVYSKPQLTWADARAFCKRQGGDLLKFDNMDDKNWIAMQAYTNPMMTLPAYWIGLNDQKTENTFLWADGSWADGDLLDWDVEPNNYVPGMGNQYKTQNCALMGIDGMFSDRNCQLVHAGTICEEATSGTCANTPSPWQSYQGHCYLIDIRWKTFREAAQFCQQSSLDLAPAADE